MTRRVWLLTVVFVALVSVGAGNAFAQEPVDARKVLEAAAKAMGTNNLKSIQFTADGFLSKVDFLKLVGDGRAAIASK